VDEHQVLRAPPASRVGVLLRLLLACISGKLGEGRVLGHDRRIACGDRNGTPCPRGASSRARL